jgi:hypothetical protein
MVSKEYLLVNVTAGVSKTIKSESPANFGRAFLVQRGCTYQ